MFYLTTTRKCLPRIFVLPSFRHITDTKNPCVLVLTRCHVTDINHVLTPCHVIEINYVDRGVAARTPLQYQNMSIKNYVPLWTAITISMATQACCLISFLV